MKVPHFVEFIIFGFVAKLKSLFVSQQLLLLGLKAVAGTLSVCVCVCICACLLFGNI